MTALEQKLTTQLEMQHEAFMQELQKIATMYEQNMNEAKAVIEKQSQTLKRYEDVSTNWQISINQEQLDELERKQNERVQNLTEQLSKHREHNQVLVKGMQDLRENLTEQLGELEINLKGLEERLNGLSSSLS